MEIWNMLAIAKCVEFRSIDLRHMDSIFAVFIKFIESMWHFVRDINHVRQYHSQWHNESYGSEDSQYSLYSVNLRYIPKCLAPRLRFIRVLMNLH